ncbi:hypothetical protein Tsubulata_017739 [Turnera subulata]|uniref:Phytocyanin domain-containing protein n=1 Tax=Turnera subulata TaxID=218843 RepID=A0A9Q0JR08_9ROSI|nr:hypothetical protein Tsubulata_017739 [Turnera subulata]
MRTLQIKIWKTFFPALILASFDASFGLCYRVGDSLWSIPPYPDFYTSWSSSHTFYVGDSLVFEFDSEFFNVLQVPRLDYDSCTTFNPMKILTVGPATVTLSEAGVFYYICNISNYCHLGQKVSVVVHKRSMNYPPSPSPSSSAPPESGRPSRPSLAPESSRGGWTNASQQVPAPGSAQPPLSIVANGNINPTRAPDGNESSFGRVDYGGMVFSWCYALCLCLLFGLV